MTTNMGVGNLRISVLIVDDHPVLLEGTRALLATASDMQVVGTTDRGGKVQELITRLRPEVLILDLYLPDQNGFEVARQVRSSFPQVKILVMTGYASAGILMPLLKLGVLGFLPKTASGEDILTAVRTVAAGKVFVAPEESSFTPNALLGQISEREHNVLARLVTGKRNAEIAKDLSLSEKTVEYHVSNLLHKLGAKSRADAIHKVRTRFPDLMFESEVS